jgi:hypothetical protein
MVSIRKHQLLEIENFLRAYPRMDLLPIRGDQLQVEGMFDFSAESKKHGRVTDRFELQIVVPAQFPKEIPIVYEVGGRIPRQGRYHINPHDYSLCLGSRLRLLTALAPVPTLMGFAINCLVPYLYAVSLKLVHGGEFAFGELPHGYHGELVDYVDLLRLRTTNQVMNAVWYLGMKKRRANKLLCPCECGQRLGVCALNRRISCKC